jgi:hypothetical protein
MKVTGHGIWESYHPNPYQEKFHAVPALSGTMIKGFIGAVRAGKSAACENEQIELCLSMPNGLSAAIRKSRSRAKFSLVDDYKKLLHGIAEWSASDECFKFPNGHQLICAPADDYNRFGSWELCSFFIQEAHEVDGKCLPALTTRLSSKYGKIGGKDYFRGYIDARGITSSHWINTDFIEKAWHFDDGYGARIRAENPDFVYFRGRTAQNEMNLPRDYEANQRRMYKNNPNWCRIYLDGEVGFDDTGTAVFGDSWDPDRHIAQIPEDKSLPILRSWDFGYRAPAVTFWQYTRSGRLLQLRELCPKNVSTDELIEMVRAAQFEHWEHRPRHAYRDYGDIAGEQTNATAGADGVDIDKVQEAFGGVVESRKARVEVGLNVLRKLMRDSVKVGNRLVPRFAVDESCVKSIEAYQGAYYYKDEPNLDRVPVKGNGYDRFADTARYVAQLVVEEGYTESEPNVYSVPVRRNKSYFASY